MEWLVRRPIGIGQQVEQMAALRRRRLPSTNATSNFEDIAGVPLPMAKASDNCKTSEQTVLQRLSIP